MRELEGRQDPDEKKHIGGFYRVRGKRTLDAVLACLLLIITVIPMLLIALLVKLTSRGEVIFRQERIGRGGEPFVCYKFRSMRKDAPHDVPTAHLEDAARYITPVGRLLRRTSLDELPQIINVLRGDMSFVGARPLIPAEESMHRGRDFGGVYELRPGITGLAQVRGRDMIDDAQKLLLDLEYAENVGFWLDLKILLRTLFCVFRGKNIRTE